VREAIGGSGSLPWVIMRALRHADVSMTLEIYANDSSTATSEALRRLGSPCDEHRCGTSLRYGANLSPHPGRGRASGLREYQSG
jgi:hypothetical protein